MATPTGARKLTDIDFIAQWDKNNRSHSVVVEILLAIGEAVGLKINVNDAGKVTLSKGESPTGVASLSNVQPFDSEAVTRSVEETLNRFLQSGMSSPQTSGTSDVVAEESFDSDRLIANLRQMFNSVLDERQRAGFYVVDEQFLDWNREISMDIRKIWGKAVYEECHKILTAARIVRIFNESTGDIRYIQEKPREDGLPPDLAVYQRKGAEGTIESRSDAGVITMPPPTYWQIVLEPVKKYCSKLWRDAKSSMWKAASYIVSIILILITVVALYNMRIYKSEAQEYRVVRTVMEHNPDGQKILNDVRSALGKPQSSPASGKEESKGEDIQPSPLQGNKKPL